MIQTNPDPIRSEFQISQFFQSVKPFDLLDPILDEI